MYVPICSDCGWQGHLSSTGKCSGLVQDTVVNQTLADISEKLDRIIEHLNIQTIAEQLSIERKEVAEEIEIHAK